MNQFKVLARTVRERWKGDQRVVVRIDEPVRSDGIWFLTIVRDGSYTIEVEWSRHLGFGLSAGNDLVLGTGVEEVYEDADGAFARIIDLLGSGAASGRPLALAELRKSQKVLQKDVAFRVGITKSGLAQIERQQSVGPMQVETVKKFVSGLGGELVMLARFPGGREKLISTD